MYVWAIIGGAVVCLLLVVIGVCVVKRRGNDDYDVKYHTLILVHCANVHVYIGGRRLFTQHFWLALARRTAWQRSQHRMDCRYVLVNI